jgi:hypothetical protein
MFTNRSCTVIVLHQCQGKKRCHCHYHPKCIYSDVSQRWRAYGNHQDS